MDWAQTADAFFKLRGGELSFKGLFFRLIHHFGFYFDSMKTSWLIIAFIALTGIVAPGQVAQSSATTTSGAAGVAQDTPWAVAQRDANSRVWQRTTYETTPDGRKTPHVHKYTELATGLCYQQNGQWLDSQEQIIILPNGTASATQGRHQAYFPGDIAQGVIELVTPDGIHMNSRPVGLSYDDGNNTVLIAELQDSTGAVMGTNQVIYTNAFTGLSADLVYTYTKAGFEQDVVLRDQPPNPESFGLNPQTTRLQVLTEFFNTPAPKQKATPVNKQDGLNDTTLTFGQMKMMRGKAFSIGNNTQANPRIQGVPTYKSWLQLQGRTILLEEMPYQRVVPQLAQLPVPAGPGATISLAGGILHKVSAQRLLPPETFSKSEVRNPKPAMIGQLAKADFNFKPGVVLDYVTVNSGETDYTFRGDTTYSVNSDEYMYGTTTFEGGTVIKFQGKYGGPIYLYGPIVCATSSYRPAVFTSFNDNSVGETIDGSSGNPALVYSQTYLNDLYGNSTYRNMRFSYAGIPIFDSSGITDIYCWDCQFLKFYIGVWFGGSANLHLRNVLMAHGNTVCFDDSCDDSGNLVLDAENLTVDDCGTLVYTCGGVQAGYTLTNSILTATPLPGSAYPSNLVSSAVLSNSRGIYQIAGAGSYYLTNSSPYRNCGTTNIDTALLADIASKTTYPPIVYSNTTISVATTFSPQAQRDTDTPDLGYHYDPIDYFFGGVSANSNLTFTAGTAVGWFYNWLGGAYGIALGDSVTATFNGSVTAPCIFARYNTVQEGGNGNWTSQGWLAGITGQSYANAAPTVTAQFTHCSMLPAEGPAIRDDWTLLIQNFTDCEFWVGGNGGYYSSVNCTNCLFFRSAPGLWWNYAAANLTLWNCTLIGGDLTADHGTGSFWPITIVNCAFDGTSIFMVDETESATGAYCDYNAFLNDADFTTVMGGHEVINLAGFNWQTSWLGNYYQSTNSPLVNRGNTTADQLGLYHFTTQTNQVPETNSIVDIGYHYVATDAYGNPLDSNGNGIPDYIEDTNGNGQPLTITLLAPTNTASYAEPATIPIQASVFDWSSVVTNVTFFQSAIQIIEITNTPYRYNWPIVAAGSYTVTATASDLAGSLTNSASVTVTVTNLCTY